MSIALLTNHVVSYRVPLYARLAAEHELEVLCFGGGERYMAPGETAGAGGSGFACREIAGWRGALRAAREHELTIAGYAGGPVLPAAYLGARSARRRFVYWASVWARPRSLTNDLAAPLTRHVQRHADAVIAYGEHVRRYVAQIRGRDDDVLIAPQAVEAELFGRAVGEAETAAFRSGLARGDGPLVLYVGRLAPGKGIEVLASAWPRVGTAGASLVVIGDGPLGPMLDGVAGVQRLGRVPRTRLPIAYAAADALVVPSVPTPRFLEPWGLVCNEAMLQATPVIASSAVGAAAGGLVRDDATGLVVAAGDPDALASAIDRLLGDVALRDRLGSEGRAAVSAYTYDAAAQAFTRAIALARAH